MKKILHLDLEGTVIRDIQNPNLFIMENFVTINNLIGEFHGFDEFRLFSFAIDKDDISLAKSLIRELQNFIDLPGNFELIPTVTDISKTLQNWSDFDFSDAETRQLLGKDIVFEKYILHVRESGIHVLVDDSILFNKTVLIPEIPLNIVMRGI